MAKTRELLINFYKKKNKLKYRKCKKIINFKDNSKRNKRFRYQKKNGAQTAQETSSSISQPPITEITLAVPSSSKLKLNKSQFLKCCLGLISVKYLPLTIFDDKEYFKKLIQPYEEEHQFELNSQYIVDTLKTGATSIQTVIKGKLWKEPVNLMVDVAILNKKAIFIISAQYLEDFKIVINTLGTIQFSMDTRVLYPRTTILNFFKNLDIDLQQIFTFTIDNRFEGNTGIPKDELDILETLNGFPDNFNWLKQIFRDELKGISSCITSPACFIHSAANDCISLLGKDFLECEENIASNYDDLDEMSDDMPMCYYNSHKWISTFNKFNSSFEYLSEQNLKDDPNWNCVSNFVEAFRPLVEFEKQLHVEQYISGDYYRDWLVCEAKLKKLDHNDYAVRLLNSMVQRKKELLDNKSFLSALYFDPRFNFFDSPYFSCEQRKQAVKHILKMHETISLIHDEKTVVKNEFFTISPTKKGPPTIVNEDPYEILEEELEILSQTPVKSQRTDSLQQKLEKISFNVRQQFSANILEYWKNIPGKDLEICEILNVFLVLPTNQKTVERISNAVSSIPIEQRPTLTDEILNNMLVVKLNENLLRDEMF